MKNKPAYKKLITHKECFATNNLGNLFNTDKERAYKLSVQAGEIFLDYSKNHITQETIEILTEFAKQQGVEKKITDLFTGKIVNISENRPALHTSLRTKSNKEVSINGANILNAVKSTQESMFAFSEKLNSGRLTGCSGKTIKHFVVLGIGGSFLGPKFVIESLKAFHTNTVSIHFIANIDESALHQTLKTLNIEECIFFIASKSFSTLETITNAKTIYQIFIEKGFNAAEIKNHFLAATSNTKAALNFGIKEKNIFPLWDWVGGRFSLWSSIGLPIVIALGKENYQQFLTGAFEMDEHFQKSELHKNMPVLLALLSFWYQQFFNGNTLAIIPYSHNLKTFPALLQQLDMESLGKSISEKGMPLDYSTGAIIWGSEGSNSQHSFHQLLHQGSHFIPIDFIVSAKPDYPENKNHYLLYTQCLAQSRSLMLGNHSNRSEANCAGNKPSNTLVLKEINPNTIGALIALYEHKIFTLSILLEINAFDQWGVEVGKHIGEEIALAVKNQKINIFDSSTNQLLDLLKQ